MRYLVVRRYYIHCALRYPTLQWRIGPRNYEEGEARQVLSPGRGLGKRVGRRQGLYHIAADEGPGQETLGGVGASAPVDSEGERVAENYPQC